MYRYGGKINILSVPLAGPGTILPGDFDILQGHPFCLNDANEKSQRKLFEPAIRFEKYLCLNKLR